MMSSVCCICGLCVCLCDLRGLTHLGLKPGEFIMFVFLLCCCMLKCIVASVFEFVVCHRCVDSCCVFGVVVELFC